MFGAIILGDLTTSDLIIDVLASWSCRNVEDYLFQVRDGQSTLVRATKEFLKKNQRNRATDGRENVKK